MKCFIILTFIAIVKGTSIELYEDSILSSDSKPSPMSTERAIEMASMKMLKACFQDVQDKNVIASPIGVLTLLSIYSAGIQGRSRDEILELLGFTDYNQLQGSYGNLTERIGLLDPSNFVLANKLFLADKFTLDSDFSTAIRPYKSEVELVDFADKVNASERINAWASEKTKGLISSAVNEDMFDEQTALTLVNVVFFKGTWDCQFEPGATTEEDFYINETTTVKKPMMKLYKTLSYGENPEIGATMVELPYKNKGFRMLVVLPTNKDGLPNVVNMLAKIGLLNSFRPALVKRIPHYIYPRRPSKREVYLEMPKFEVRSDLDLKEILPKMGVSSMFYEGTTGVVREREVVVSAAFQKAFVKVDEEGATAAAFTDLTLTYRSAIVNPFPPIHFKADHPFLYAIVYENIVLFTGTYTH